MFTRFLSKTTTENQGFVQFLLLVVDWLHPARLEIYSCLAISLSDLITERFEFCKSEALFPSVCFRLFSRPSVSRGWRGRSFSFVVLSLHLSISIALPFLCSRLGRSFVRALVPSFFRAFVLTDLFILEVPLLNIFLLSQVRCLLEFMGCGIRTYLQ